MEGAGVSPLCCETMLPLSTSIANYRCKNLLPPTEHASKYLVYFSSKQKIWYIL